MRSFSSDKLCLSMSFHGCIFEFLYGRKLESALSSVSMLWHVNTGPLHGSCQIESAHSLVQILPFKIGFTPA
jgi:hypothetical protein